jgi:diacylglycerol kinase family enzyme
VESLTGLDSFRIEATGDGSFPLQVDGDYVGDLRCAEFGVAPHSLSVVS